MRSKFQFFFIIMKLLLAIVVVVFIALPAGMVIYSINHTDAIIPAIIACLVFSPFAYLLIRDNSVIKIELTDNAMVFKSIINTQTMCYPYTDITGIKIQVEREESYSPYGRLVDVNYDPRAIVYFKDGNEFVLYDDTYSNVYDMVEFIESKRIL